MPIYEYKCRTCGLLQHLNQPISSHRPSSLTCQCGQHAKRVFGFRMGEIFHGHYNPTVGRYVTGKNDFNSALSRASDEASESTGIPHNYVPMDLRDREQVGVTEEGMAATHDARVAAGTLEPSGNKVFPLSDD